ncbi:MAG: hypothetical protein AAGJ52_11440, partial [Pseudomonadota bacterium]
MSTSPILKFHHWLIPPRTEQGWLPYLWLVYLMFFFIEWFFRPVGGLEQFLSLLTVATFLTLYFSGFRRRGLIALLHVIGIASLGALWSGFNSGASVYFIYAASFAYLVGTTRLGLLVIFGVALMAAVTAL